MSSPGDTPEVRFATVVTALRSEPAVTCPSDIPHTKKFGASPELRVNNKIFAMLVRGALVVKLPQQRVDALVTAGDGARFDPGRGRLMKEWLTLAPTSDADWLSLAREALGFVNTKR